MSTLLSHSYSDFDLGDEVSFLCDGLRLYGEVVRVYNTRDNYHVEVDGRRYFVSRQDDDMRRER